MDQKPARVDAFGRWVDVLRNLAAILFIPFLCVYAAGIVLILWQDFGATGDKVVTLRVVDYLGATLLGLMVLIALGTLWYQRREVPSLSVKTPWGEAVIGKVDEIGTPLAAAVVDTVTQPDAPSVKGAVVPPPAPEGVEVAVPFTVVVVALPLAVVPVDLEVVVVAEPEPEVEPDPLVVVVVTELEPPPPVAAVVVVASRAIAE